MEEVASNGEGGYRVDEGDGVDVGDRAGGGEGVGWVDGGYISFTISFSAMIYSIMFSSTRFSVTMSSLGSWKRLWR